MANGNDNGNAPSPAEIQRLNAAIEARKEDLLVAQERLATEESITNQAKAQEAFNDLLLAQHRKALALATNNTEEYEKQLRYIAELRAANEELNKNTEKQRELRGDAQQFAKGFGEMLGLQASYEETIVGKLTNRLQLLGKNEKYQKDFTEQLKKTFSVSNLVAGAFEHILESTVRVAAMYDSAAASFNQLTGEGGRYNQMINEMSTGNLQFGIGVTENAASMGALYTNMAAFTNESAETQKQLTGLVSKLDKLGVNASTSADILNTFTKGMGMTSIASADLLRNLTEFGSTIGVSTAQIAENVQKSLPVFIRFGRTVGEQVFKNLQIESKKTGIALDGLISIAEGLNTFESAASMAGQLNAVLGGNLINSVELTTASYDKKLKMIKDSILLSGVEFDTLGHLEKQMFANIVANGDMEKASKLLTRQTALEIEENRKLEKRIAAVNSVTDKLNFLMQSFAITMGPVIDKVSGFITSMTKFAEENRTTAKVIAGFVIVLSAFYVGMLALSAVLPVVSLLLPSFGAGATAASGGVAALGAASTAAAPGLGVLALSFLAVGAGVALIGTGIYLATTGFAEMFSVLSKAAEGGILTEVILGLTAITGLLLVAAKIAMLVSPGFYALAGGVAAIGLALKLISSSDLIALGLFSSGLGKLATGNVSGVTQAMVSLKEAFVAANAAGDDTINRATALVKAMSAQNAAASAAAFSTPAPSGVQSSSGGGGNNGNTTVILKINNREFGRAVLNSLEREMDLSVN